MSNNLSKMMSSKKMYKYDWDKIRNDTFKYIDSLSLTQIKDIISITNSKFHNGKSIVSDAVFDLIVELFNKKGGKISSVGADIMVDKQKAKLPVYMGSMRKFKPEDDIDSWKKKYLGEYVISDKLDGISGLGFQIAERWIINIIEDELDLADLIKQNQKTIGGETLIAKKK